MTTLARIRLRIAPALAAGALLAGPAPGAAADGLPIAGGLDTTSQGVLSSSGALRYLAVSRGDRTLVMQVATGTGQLLAHTWIDGSWSVPGVAVDGDTSGVSADGETLVLIRPRVSFPQRETRLAVLDTDRLRVGNEIDLDGDFSFDAISPDGSTGFMVQYPDPRDRAHYRLRVLDLRTGDLEPGSLLPPGESEEEMRGMPLARATADEGRWEMTLYDGGRLYRYGPGKPGEPFVHAIDTVTRRTLCIDLDWEIDRRTLESLQLVTSEDEAFVEVGVPGEEPLGRIDVATGEAIEASEELPDEGALSEGSSLWPGLGIAAATAAALGGVAVLSRRRA